MVDRKPAMTEPNGLYAWMDDAACKGQPLQAFFFDSAESLIELPGVSICNGCTVRAECLAYAVEKDVQHGVFGGLTPFQRRNIKPTTRPN
jgi:WhiB family redox-sensing transcriptional regulator